MRATPIIDGKKVCSICKLPKYLFEFAKDKSRKNGVRGECKLCKRKYVIATRPSRAGQERSEAKIDYDKKYYIDNKEVWKVSGKFRYEKNKEEILEAGSLRYYTDPEFREYKKGVAKRWATSNPDKVKAGRSKRKARVRNAPGGHHTAAEWISKLAEYKGICAYCPDKATTKDHVVPLARGGTNEISNVVPACLPCNTSKRARLLSEWKGRPKRGGT